METSRDRMLTIAGFILSFLLALVVAIQYEPSWKDTTAASRIERESLPREEVPQHTTVAEAPVEEAHAPYEVPEAAKPDLPSHIM